MYASYLLNIYYLWPEVISWSLHEYRSHVPAPVSVPVPVPVQVPLPRKFPLQNWHRRQHTWNATRELKPAPAPLSLGLLVCHLRSVNLTPHTWLTEAQTACSVVYRPVVKDGLNIFLAPHRTRPISPTANTTYVFMIARQWYVIFSTLFPGISLSFGTFQLLTIGYFSR